jgi:type II secretory pathway predicted ATPase ExeA
MHESSFGLSERPFPAAPSAAAYFAATSHEQARRQLERCIERAEGVGIIVGGAGTGKSLLLQLLADEFRDQFHVVLLAGSALCTRRALLQNILFELNLPYRGLQEGELRLSLIDHLQPSRECPLGMLLLVDEDHTLPMRLLEELRLLTNLVREGSPRVRLVLAGSQVLEERLASPKLESFSQRIAARMYLQPLKSAETVDYITRELARCGGRAEMLFAPDALRAVHTASAGIPRLINQVCDHALTWATTHCSSRIDSGIVQEAWADLQQLPSPTQEPAPVSAAIEFGTLDDDECIEEEEFEASVAAKLIDESAAPVADMSPSAAELFGGDFEEEELIIDRYAALDIQAGPKPTQVRTPEGEAFAREVATMPLIEAPPAIRIANPTHVSEDVGPLASRVASARNRAAKHNQSSVVDFHPADDPVYPEPQLPPKAARVVAIDGAHDGPPGAHGSSAAVARFRNLFSSLRGKQT